MFINYYYNMSAQYLNANEPNLDQKIRVYSAVVKENLVVEGEASVVSKMSVASNVNPGTTRLFTVTHSGVFDSTMVLLSRANSTGTNQQLLTWVAYTTVGTIRIGLHNLSTIAATGSEDIIIKLIQNV